MKRSGTETSPRSAGFSMMNSVPARWANMSRAHILLTTLLARSSSARCLDGRKRQPMISMRVRTGGGPPSGEVSERKNLEIEKVLHGGAAMMMAYSPRTMRSRSCKYTDSLVMSAASPPPELGSLSKRSTSSPRRRANCARPSGRLYAPEKRSSTFIDWKERAADARVAPANASGRLVACCGGTVDSSTSAFTPPAETSSGSADGAAVGVGAPTRCSPAGRQGKRLSSKYTSEVWIILCCTGSQML